MTGSEEAYTCDAGEDTALAPLIPRLVSVLENLQGGAVGTDQVAAVGQTYVDAMRTRFSSGQAPKRIVDKMLRNAWNVGYIFLMLPKVGILACISKCSQMMALHIPAMRDGGKIPE